MQTEGHDETNTLWNFANASKKYAPERNQYYPNQRIVLLTYTQAMDFNLLAPELFL